MKSHTAWVPVLIGAFTLALAGLPGTAFAQDQPFQEDAAAATGMGCACLVLTLLIAVASVAIWIGIVVWVYRDATARGAENAVLWLILVLVTGLIGLIIYLIVRPGKPGS